MSKVHRTVARKVCSHVRAPETLAEHPEASTGMFAEALCLLPRPGSNPNPGRRLLSDLPTGAGTGTERRTRMTENGSGRGWESHSHARSQGDPHTARSTERTHIGDSTCLSSDHSTSSDTTCRGTCRCGQTANKEKDTDQHTIQ